jgi:hypothetical protein
MADINELQQAINERRVNPKDLNEEQRYALDEAFRSGELKGYTDFNEYRGLFDVATKSLAIAKQKELEPLKTSTGIEREDLVFAGAATGSMVPFMRDRKTLLDAYQRYGFKDYYGVDTRFADMSDIYNKRLTVLSDQMKKLPTIKGPLGLPIRLLKGTATMLDDYADTFNKFSKFGASPALATTYKSALLGAGGAAGGSLAYDIGNLGANFTGSVSQELANVTDNEIRQLPFEQRIFVNALKEAQTDAIFSGAATALTPIWRFAASGIKQSLGLNSDRAKAIATAAQESGQDVNLVSLIGTDNAFQKFFKNFFSTIGVYPIVGSPLIKFNKEFDRKLTQEVFMDKVDSLNLAPLSNINVLNYSAINTLKKEFKNVNDVIENEYKDFRRFYEEIGNPTFIPTTNIKKETGKMLQQLKDMYPQDRDIFDSIEKGARELTDADDPLVAYMKYLNTIGNYSYRTDVPANYIRLSDWQGLSRMQTVAYSNSKYRTVANQIDAVRYAMERDLNSLQQATVRDELKEKIFKERYNELLSAQGPAKAEEFIDTQIKTAGAAFQRLKEANAFFSMAIRPFEKGAVAQKLKAVDRSLFADKGIDMVGKASINADEIWDKAIKRIFTSDSPEAIRQIKSLMGVTRSTYDVLDDAGKIVRSVKIPESIEGKEVYNRYVRQFVWDAFNESTERPLRDLASIAAEDIAIQAQKRGLVRPAKYTLDKNLEQKIRAKTRMNELIDPAEIDARIFFEKDGIANIKDGVLRGHDFGAFFPDKMVRNLGLDKPQGRDKLIEVFGGGEKGKKAVSNIEEVLKVASAVKEVDYTDPSKFVQRSLTLKAGAGTAITTSATAAAIGFGSTFKLILGGRLLGEILANPKLAEDVMDMNRFLRIGTAPTGKKAISLEGSLYPKARQTYVRFLNSLFESAGDDFRVDPDKIDFEEIRQKINSLDPNVPITGKYDFGSMPKFTRDRVYPEYEAVKKLTSDQIANGERMLEGFNVARMSADNFDKVANSVPKQQTQQMPQATGQPRAPQAGFQGYQLPQAPGANFAVDYSSLFPQDTLGGAISQRQQMQGFNEGGLVELVTSYETANLILEDAAKEYQNA